MRHMAQTSLTTYSNKENQTEFKTVKEEILFLLKYKYQNGATIRDLSKDLNRGENCISGRLTELVKEELIIPICTRKIKNQCGTTSTMNVYEAR